MHIACLSLARRKLDAKGAHGDATVNSSRKRGEDREGNFRKRVGGLMVQSTPHTPKMCFEYCPTPCSKAHPRWKRLFFATLWRRILVDEEKPLLVNHSTVFFFPTFEMDHLGKIRQHHWKERLLTDCHDCNKRRETNMLWANASPQNVMADYLSEHLCQLPKRVKSTL